VKKESLIQIQKEALNVLNAPQENTLLKMEKALAIGVRVEPLRVPEDMKIVDGVLQENSIQKWDQCPVQIA